MRALFVVDEYPFPPRNGITVPVANFISQFASAGVLVDLLWFDLEPAGSTPVVDGPVQKVIRVPMKRRGHIASAVAAECLGVSPVFSAWEPVRGFPVPEGGRYDLIWASPIRSFGIWLKHAPALGMSGDRVWAAINDSYTLTLLELARRQVSLPLRILYRLRARGMRYIEPRLLRNADLVAVQSDREMDFFREAFGRGAGPSLLELKNGVGDNLFEPRQTPRTDLLFVGTLDAFYKPTLEWFIDKVYSTLPEPRPSFTVIGKGANDSDRERFDRLSIDYRPFVEDIADAYLSARILVAPIFKGYGTINKVLEGMAAGCVVIGDPTAFNGISHFDPGRHALVAERPEEFAEAILSTLADPDGAALVGERARDLMRRDFSWSSRAESVLAMWAGE